MSAENAKRPPSTVAQIVTATCAAACAAVLAIGAVFAFVVFLLAGGVISGLDSAGTKAMQSLAVPAVESLCLNYTATVLELEEAGLSEDEIGAVIARALPVEDVPENELSELRSLSLASADTCGSVRDVLTAAGR